MYSSGLKSVRITDSGLIPLATHLKQVPPVDEASTLRVWVLHLLHLTSLNPSGVLYVFLLIVIVENLERLDLSPL